MEGIGQLAKSVANSVEVLPLIYKDLAQPSVQKVGKALETVFDLGNTVLLPIKLANERSKYWFDKHMNDYKAKLDTIPDEKICEVPPELGVPLIDRLTYTTNEDIADLFTTLLTKASSIDTANQAHPKFVSIISSLSVDEAKIIKHIKSDILYSSLKLYVKENEGYKVIISYATGLEFDVNLLFPENMNTYIENLTTLGILTDMIGTYKVNKDMYNRLHSLYSNVEEEIKGICGERLERLEWDDSYFKLNDLGALFIKSCNMI